MELIVTIDTEGDNQWDHGRDVTVENLKYIPRFQNLCEKFKIVPTYLVTSEVCSDDFSKEYLGNLNVSGKAEIGSHLHSWTTPPFNDKPGYKFNDKNHSYASELPEELMRTKLRNLTEQITSAFGKRPTSFRSGRYGFNENVARALSENAYIVDSSVTPYTSWSSHPGLSDGFGGPDFLDKDPFPYYFNFPAGSLLEIPVTILPTVFPLNKHNSFASYYFSNVNNSYFLRVLRKLLFRNQPLWLRPFEWMTSEMLREVVDAAEKLRLPFIVMMFHSSELMPGCSIYRPDEKSVEILYDLLEDFFRMTQDRKIHSMSLTEAALNFKK
jgi:peptidoglycan/xylan/chitin deacetylase (PgdA/CDA1 family)